METSRRVARGLFPGYDVEQDISWFDGTRPMDLASDGSTMVFVESWEAGAPHYVSYLRKTDGSAAVRLGDGDATGLSPDGRWVVLLPPGEPPCPVRLPTGPGEPRRVDARFVTRARFSPRWLPDGRRVLFTGVDEDGRWRVFLYDVESAETRWVTPVGFQLPHMAACVSPDGHRFVALDESEHAVACRLDGGAPVPIPAWTPADRMIQWTTDGNSLFVYRPGELPVTIAKLDLESGARAVWKALSPADAAGVRAVDRILVTPDGGSYVYNYIQRLSTLFAVAGIDARATAARGSRKASARKVPRS